ncbi:MAG: histidine kinase [Actinomycetota bacterium]|nr:histidine kinase [Actinomycetota bacterium]
MFRLHRNGTYLEFAGDLTRLATPADELLGANMHKILPAEVSGALMGCVERALGSGQLQTVEYRLRTHAGDERDFEARVVRAGENEVVTVVRDVTELKLAEQERRESRARVVAAEEAERVRLERNLHDGAQQRFVTANVNLHLADRDLERNPAAARAFLATAQAELTAGLAEIRQLSQGLHPHALAVDGLAAAVRALVENTFVPVELEELPAERLPEPVEVVAYYVIAESLANAAKHANATRIVVAARLRGDELVAEIVDDGEGGADVAGGSGLRGLVARVAAVGGRLEVASPTGQGTRVRAAIPVESRLQ